MENHEAAANSQYKNLADANLVGSSLEDGLTTQLKFQMRWRVLSCALMF